MKILIRVILTIILYVMYVPLFITLAISLPIAIYLDDEYKFECYHSQPDKESKGHE